MFGFRQQPLKAVYIAYTLSALPFKLSYWATTSLLPAWRPRPSWSFGRSVTVNLLRSIIGVIYATGLFVVEDAEKSSKSADKLGFVWVDPLPSELLKGEIASMAEINKIVSIITYGFWYGKDVGTGSHGGKAQPDERVLYHLHGGGYIMGSANPAGPLGSVIGDFAKECATVLQRTFCLNYRLSSASPFQPENAFPAALIDALAGYRYLVETLGFNPANIVVSGDSAGGHLAFVLVRYLVQEAVPTLPPPRALVLLSPTVDWACTHDENPDSSMTLNARSDTVQTILESGYSARALCGSLPEGSVANNSWISPSSLLIDTRGLYINFPSTFILAGGAEQTLDPIKTLYNRLQTDNDAQRIQYSEYADATHDFIMAAYHEPEKTNGAKEVAQWIGKLYAN